VAINAVLAKILQNTPLKGQNHNWYLQRLSDCKKDNISFCNFNYFYYNFPNEFNLSFFQCKTCVVYKNTSETDKVNLKEFYDQHLVEKELSGK